MKIEDYVSTLEKSSQLYWAETLDYSEEEGLETTLYAIRFNKKDTEPKYKKVFIESEKRKRINSDVYFYRTCGWRVLFEKRKMMYGSDYIYPFNELYEGDCAAPNISSTVRLWDIKDLHSLCPETKYFKDVPSAKIIEFIKMWRKYPEVEFVWKDKDLKWHWNDSRIYKLKNKREIIKILKKNGGQLNDALGLIKYGSKEKMEKERNANHWKKKFKGYKIAREHLYNFDNYFKEQKCKEYDYRDYLDLCIYFKKELNHSVLFPHNFQESHDNLVRLKALKEEKKKNSQLKKYEKRFMEIANRFEQLLNDNSNNDYQLTIPKTVDEFINIGNEMSICVGTNGYDKKMYERKCIIVVAYCNDSPVVCVELDNKFKVRQLRGIHNQYTKECEDVTPLIASFRRGATALAI